MSNSLKRLEQDGKVYIGEVNEQGIPQGMGILLVNGSQNVGTFEGSFEMNYPGMICDPNGDVVILGDGVCAWFFKKSGDRYEGEVEGLNRTGYGVYYFADGSTYTGQFVNGSAVGYGVLQKAKSTFLGDFSLDTPNGYGCMFLGQGSYLGSFSSGKRSGYGVFADSRMETRGEWKNDEIVRFGDFNGKVQQAEELATQASEKAANQVTGPIRAALYKVENIRNHVMKLCLNLRRIRENVNKNAGLNLIGDDLNNLDFLTSTLSLSLMARKSGEASVVVHRRDLSPQEVSLPIIIDDPWPSQMLRQSSFTTPKRKDFSSPSSASSMYYTAKEPPMFSEQRKIQRTSTLEQVKTGFGRDDSRGVGNLSPEEIDVGSGGSIISSPVVKEVKARLGLGRRSTTETIFSNSITGEDRGEFYSGIDSRKPTFIIQSEVSGNGGMLKDSQSQSSWNSEKIFNRGDVVLASRESKSSSFEQTMYQEKSVPYFNKSLSHSKTGRPAYYYDEREGKLKSNHNPGTSDFDVSMENLTFLPQTRKGRANQASSPLSSKNIGNSEFSTREDFVSTYDNISDVAGVGSGIGKSLKRELDVGQKFSDKSQTFQMESQLKSGRIEKRASPSKSSNASYTIESHQKNENLTSNVPHSKVTDAANKQDSHYSSLVGTSQNELQYSRMKSSSLFQQNEMDLSRTKPESDEYSNDFQKDLSNPISSLNAEFSTENLRFTSFVKSRRNVEGQQFSEVFREESSKRSDNPNVIGQDDSSNAKKFGEFSFVTENERAAFQSHLRSKKGVGSDINIKSPSSETFLRKESEPANDDIFGDGFIPLPRYSNSTSQTSQGSIAQDLEYQQQVSKKQIQYFKNENDGSMQSKELGQDADLLATQRHLTFRNLEKDGLMDLHQSDSTQNFHQLQSSRDTNSRKTYTTSESESFHFQRLGSQKKDPQLYLNRPGVDGNVDSFTNLSGLVKPLFLTKNLSQDELLMDQTERTRGLVIGGVDGNNTGLFNTLTEQEKQPNLLLTRNQDQYERIIGRNRGRVGADGDGGSFINLTEQGGHPNLLLKKIQGQDEDETGAPNQQLRYGKKGRENDSMFLLGRSDSDSQTEKNLSQLNNESSKSQFREIEFESLELASSKRTQPIFEKRHFEAKDGYMKKNLDEQVSTREEWEMLGGEEKAESPIANYKSRQIGESGRKDFQHNDPSGSFLKLGGQIPSNIPKGGGSETNFKSLHHLQVDPLSLNIKQDVKMNDESFLKLGGDSPLKFQNPVHLLNQDYAHLQHDTNLIRNTGLSLQKRPVKTLDSETLPPSRRNDSSSRLLANESNSEEDFIKLKIGQNMDDDRVDFVMRGTAASIRKYPESYNMDSNDTERYDFGTEEPFSSNFVQLKQNRIDQRQLSNVNTLPPVHQKPPSLNSSETRDIDHQNSGYTNLNRSQNNQISHQQYRLNLNGQNDDESFRAQSNYFEQEEHLPSSTNSSTLRKSAKGYPETSYEYLNITPRGENLTTNVELNRRKQQDGTISFASLQRGNLGVDEDMHQSQKEYVHLKKLSQAPIAGVHRFDSDKFISTEKDLNNDFVSLKRNHDPKDMNSSHEVIDVSRRTTLGKREEATTFTELQRDFSQLETTSQNKNDGYNVQDDANFFSIEKQRNLTRPAGLNGPMDKSHLMENNALFELKKGKSHSASRQEYYPNQFNNEINQQFHQDDDMLSDGRKSEYISLKSQKVKLNHDDQAPEMFSDVEYETLLRSNNTDDTNDFSEKSFSNLKLIRNGNKGIYQDISDDNAFGTLRKGEVYDTTNSRSIEIIDGQSQGFSELKLRSHPGPGSTAKVIEDERHKSKFLTAPAYTDEEQPANYSTRTIYSSNSPHKKYSSNRGMRQTHSNDFADHIPENDKEHVRLQKKADGLQEEGFKNVDLGFPGQTSKSTLIHSGVSSDHSFVDRLASNETNDVSGNEMEQAYSQVSQNDNQKNYAKKQDLLLRKAQTNINPRENHSKRTNTDDTANFSELHLRDVYQQGNHQTNDSFSPLRLAQNGLNQSEYMRLRQTRMDESTQRNNTFDEDGSLPYQFSPGHSERVELKLSNPKQHQTPQMVEADEEYAQIGEEENELKFLRQSPSIGIRLSRKNLPEVENQQEIGLMRFRKARHTAEDLSDMNVGKKADQESLSNDEQELNKYDKNLEEQWDQRLPNQGEMDYDEEMQNDLVLLRLSKQKPVVDQLGLVSLVRSNKTGQNERESNFASVQLQTGRMSPIRRPNELEHESAEFLSLRRIPTDIETNQYEATATESNQYESADFLSLKKSPRRYREGTSETDLVTERHGNEEEISIRKSKMKTSGQRETEQYVPLRQYEKTNLSMETGFDDENDQFERGNPEKNTNFFDTGDGSARFQTLSNFNQEYRSASKDSYQTLNKNAKRNQHDLSHLASVHENTEYANLRRPNNKLDAAQFDDVASRNFANLKGTRGNNSSEGERYVDIRTVGKNRNNTSTERDKVISDDEHAAKETKFVRLVKYNEKGERYTSLRPVDKHGNVEDGPDRPDPNTDFIDNSVDPQMEGTFVKLIKFNEKGDKYFSLGRVDKHGNVEDNDENYQAYAKNTIHLQKDRSDEDTFNTNDHQSLDIEENHGFKGAFVKLIKFNTKGEQYNILGRVDRHGNIEDTLSPESEQDLDEHDIKNSSKQNEKFGFKDIGMEYTSLRRVKTKDRSLNAHHKQLQSENVDLAEGVNSRTETYPSEFVKLINLNEKGESRTSVKRSDKHQTKEENIKYDDDERVFNRTDIEKASGRGRRYLEDEQEKGMEYAFLNRVDKEHINENTMDEDDKRRESLDIEERMDIAGVNNSDGKFVKLVKFNEKGEQYTSLKRVNMNGNFEDVVELDGSDQYLLRNNQNRSDRKGKFLMEEQEKGTRYTTLKRIDKTNNNADELDEDEILRESLDDKMNVKDSQGKFVKLTKVNGEGEPYTTLRRVDENGNIEESIILEDSNRELGTNNQGDFSNRKGKFLIEEQEKGMGYTTLRRDMKQKIKEVGMYEHDNSMQQGSEMRSPNRGDAKEKFTSLTKGNNTSGVEHMSLKSRGKYQNPEDQTREVDSEDYQNEESFRNIRHRDGGDFDTFSNYEGEAILLKRHTGNLNKNDSKLEEEDRDGDFFENKGNYFKLRKNENADKLNNNVDDELDEKETKFHESEKKRNNFSRRKASGNSDLVDDDSADEFASSTFTKDRDGYAKNHEKSLQNEPPIYFDLAHRSSPSKSSNQNISNMSRFPFAELKEEVSQDPTTLGENGVQFTHLKNVTAEHRNNFTDIAKDPSISSLRKGQSLDKTLSTSIQEGHQNGDGINLKDDRDVEEEDEERVQEEGQIERDLFLRVNSPNVRNVQGGNQPESFGTLRGKIGRDSKHNQGQLEASESFQELHKIQPGLSPRVASVKDKIVPGYSKVIGNDDSDSFHELHKIPLDQLKGEGGIASTNQSILSPIKGKKQRFSFSAGDKEVEAGDDDEDDDEGYFSLGDDLEHKTNESLFETRKEFKDNNVSKTREHSFLNKKKDSDNYNQQRFSFVAEHSSFMNQQLNSSSYIPSLAKTRFDDVRMGGRLNDSLVTYQVDETIQEVSILGPKIGTLPQRNEELITSPQPRRSTPLPPPLRQNEFLSPPPPPPPILNEFDTPPPPPPAIPITPFGPPNVSPPPNVYNLRSLFVDKNLIPFPPE